MTDILIGNGTPIILADSTDYNPTSGVSLLGTRTHQLDLTSVAAAAYRQSAKFDFGATRARNWYCRAAFEPTSAPTAGTAVEVFIGFSDNSSATVGNPGNLSGSDAAYTGYGAAATDANECIGQLMYLGNVVVSADADIMVGEVGAFTPQMRYGIIVVRNGMNVAMIGDAVEMSVQLWPVVEQF
jgi:hypothetical protein